MSKMLKHMVSVAGCTLFLSTAAFAQTASSPNTVAFEEMDPKMQRRMGFYAERTLGALLALAEDDIRVSQDGAQPNRAVTNNFREALERFVSAGLEAGMSRTGLAEYLSEQFSQNYTGPAPNLFVTPDGNLDSRTLVEGTITNLAAKAEQDSAQQIDYMSMISSEGAAVKEEILSHLHDADSPSGAAPTTTDQETEAAPSVSIGEKRQSILDRVEGTGPDRTITIAPGDTLAVIAQAVYGDTLRYRDIYSANTDVLSSPNNVSVGVVLKLPEN